MQVTGNFFWMQNEGQSTTARTNPLLQQALNAIAQQSDTKAADAVSKETQAQMRQVKEEARIDPAEKALREAMKELMSVEQNFYGALHDARSELRNLVDMHETFTGILDGTADYEMALRDGWFIDPKDQGKFEFTDFETYLQEKGYQGDATKPVDYLTAEWVTAENSMGMSVGMLAGQTLVKGPAGTLDKVIYEDQVPLYEQWQEEKQAFEVAALKEYAAEKLPSVQKRIADFPKRINAIMMEYSARRLEIISKLPEDALPEDFKDNLKAVNGLAEKMNKLEPGDGKALLDLLQQMMDKQAENVRSLGGVANDGFGGRLKMGRLPVECYA